MDWLNHHADTIIYAITFLWGLRKVFTEHHGFEALKDTLLHDMRAEGYKLLAEPGGADKARTAMEWVAQTTLERMKIKRGPLVDKLVQQAIAIALKELAQRLSEVDLARIAADSAAVNDAFKPPDNPTVPKLDVVLVPDPPDPPKDS